MVAGLPTVRVRSPPPEVPLQLAIAFVLGPYRATRYNLYNGLHAHSFLAPYSWHR